MKSPERIQTLPRNVAERIAAGEVIERPSSVVKELVENSIDAHATSIEVQLEDGGKQLIQVTDDGHGIHPEDLALALERHATSKLKSLDDLEKIGTLGFRGEALPSIAAVSDLEVLSRRVAEVSPSNSAASAFHVRVSDSYWAGGAGDGQSLQAKPIAFGQFLGREHGTQIRAQSLFSQIPARQKFLKSNSSESSQVRDWMERLSLTHPSIGFRLVNDGKTLFQVRSEKGEDAEKNRVHAILAGGEDFPIASRRIVMDSGIEVRAYWVQGMSLSHTRKLVQVVNGRAVRDRLLQQAILSPFKQTLLPGQFPAIAVFLDLPLSSVDVNVHPTKSEVRFLDSSQVFRAVAETLEKLIRENGSTGFLSSGNSFAGASVQPSQSYSPAGYTPRFSLNPPAMDSGAPQAQSQKETMSDFVATPSAAAPIMAATLASPQGPAAEALSGSFRGTFFCTYVALEKGEELVLIDQHAADERIRYERLKAKILDPKRAAEPQQLLIPEVVFFDPDKQLKMKALTAENGLLSRLGFESEIFGDDKIVIRSMPADWGNHTLKVRLKNLVERLLELSDAEVETADRSLVIDERMFEKIASEACRSSVMAGDDLSEESALSLIESLKKSEHPWNCPHGRPTLVRVPKARLEEWFQRKL